MHEDNSGQQFRGLGMNPNANLPEEHKLMIDLEREYPRHSGAKEVAIRDRFDISATRYYQKLGAIMSTDAADDYDPMTTRRFLRIREERQAGRSARRMGIHLS